MKKLTLMTMLALCFAASSVFAAVPVGFNWNLTDVTKIDECLKSNEEINKNNKRDFEHLKFYLLFMKKTINKDATNISYTDFKKIVADTFIEVFTNNEFQINQNVCIMSYNVIKFRPFCKQVLEDKDITSVYKYVYNENFAYKEIPIVEFRKNTIDLINKYNSYIPLVKSQIRFYKNRLIEIDNTDALKDLKTIKKIIYSNISKSEDWKKIVVEVELMIKSLE